MSRRSKYSAVSNTSRYVPGTRVSGPSWGTRPSSFVREDATRDQPCPVVLSAISGAASRRTAIPSAGLPLAASSTCVVMWLAWVLGVPQILQRNWNPTHALEVLNEWEGTFVQAATPFLTDLVHEVEGLDLTNFRPDRNAAAGGALPKVAGTTR